MAGKVEPCDAEIASCLMEVLMRWDTKMLLLVVVEEATLLGSYAVEESIAEEVAGAFSVLSSTLSSSPSP